MGDDPRVGVRVVTRSEDAVLSVPVSAVFPLPQGDTGTNAVVVLEGGRAWLRPVDRGGRGNTGDAWIQNGLGAGPKGIVHPPAMGHWTGPLKRSWCASGRSTPVSSVTGR